MIFQDVEVSWIAGITFSKRGSGVKNFQKLHTWPRSAVGNASGNRFKSDSRSRGREFDPSPVPYFLGDWSWNNFYGHSPPFRWIIQEGLFISYKQKYVHEVLVNCLFKLAQEKVGLGQLTVPSWPLLLTWDVKQQKQTNKAKTSFFEVKLRFSAIHLKQQIHDISKERLENDYWVLYNSNLILLWCQNRNCNALNVGWKSVFL